MSCIPFGLVFNIFVFYMMRFILPTEWPPSGQVVWFGIFRLKDEIANQSFRSQLIIPFRLRVNMLCITVGLVLICQFSKLGESSA